MELKEIKISNDLPDIEKIKHLMDTAFPKGEQTPFDLLVKANALDAFSFSAYYDEGTFCGISCVVMNPEFVFVLYLAINPEIRSSGYGGRIIETIKSRHKQPVVLNVETLDPNAENAEQRERRVAFYNKHGILDTGFRFVDKGNHYTTMSSDPASFSSERFMAFLAEGKKKAAQH